MGQSVSADRKPPELKSLFVLGQGFLSKQPLPTAAGGQGLFDGNVKHHVKAWKFEKNGHAVVDSPAQLCNEQGQFGAELRRNCSYLILHIYSPAARKDDLEPGGCANAPGASATLEELAALAGANCSPRGLAVEVVMQSEVDSGDGKIPPLSYGIYVWHGVNVEPRVKAQVLTKSFELDRLLRVGLLWQPALQSPGAAVLLKSHSNGTASRNVGDQAEAVRHSANSLLRTILDGSSPAPSVPTSLLGITSSSQSSSRGNGVQRFPRLGLSVCRSLGMAPSVDNWAQRRIQASAPPPAAAPAPAPAVSVMGGAGQRVAMPRLQLGAALKVGTAVGEEAPADASMDVDSNEGEPNDGGARKRGRGADAARPPLRTTTNSGTPASTMVPKVARTDLSLNLPLPSPRGDGQCDSVGSGNVPSQDHDSSSISDRSIRTDPPTMLNLEDINMSEEDLIRSYDPENEENNYHLPHHLYKKLQLDQFRPVCSEVLKNSLFISSHQVAADLEILKRSGITHIVNTAADVCFNHFQGQFQYLTYYLKDANNEEISILFYRTLKWVSDAIESGGRVLIHCREGVSRSSTMIIAFLMWKFNLPFEAAHDRIRKVRQICNPNTGFTCQLLVHAKRLGIGGVPYSPPTDRPTVYRVAPYHPMEPFLLLLVTDWLPSPNSPNFDPRFGWVVQRGLEAVLWIGAQVADAEATQSAVHQHFSLCQIFERIEVRVSTTQDGLEPPQFWQLLGLTAAPADRCKFTAPRAAFDADAEILGVAQVSSARPPVADDLQLTSARDQDVPSPATSSPGSDEQDVSSPEAAQMQRPQPTGPPMPRLGIPALALGGLRVTQPP